MPLYDYRCQECGTLQEDVLAKMKEQLRNCEECGGVMKRQMHSRFSINMGGVPTGGYYDSTLGAHVETVTQKKRLMQEQGVTEKGGTPKPNGGAWV